MATPDQHLDETRAQGIAELEAFLRIPSISSQPDQADNVRRAAAYLAEQYERIGLENMEVMPTSGHPVVYADWVRDPERPTVLLYGHYDVQPVDPIDLWSSPPFEPVQRDGQLFARGASDDKGQIAIHWQAIDALMRTTGELPVNLKVIAEGEEEVGSQHFDEFVAAHQERLAADYTVVSDTAMAGKGLPAITYALRGLLYFELRVETASTDLHSGEFGGIAPNPIQLLSELLVRLKDPSGHILVPGFYDGVRPISDEERRQFERLPVDEADYQRMYGLTGLAGEPGFTPRERAWARPTLDANGVWGGYQGPGQKTIIPAWAAAKLSCRLVPDQDANAVSRALRDHIESARPRGARITLTQLDHAEPWITPTDHPLLRAGAAALTKAYGVEPVLTRSGGSIGAVHSMSRHLQTPCLLVGFVQPDCFMHAPDERLDLDSFFAGRKAALHLWEEVGQLPRSKLQ